MKLLRDKYQSRFIVYDNEAYNLPLDVIYYIESSWNYKLNNYVYSHQEDIAKLLRTKLADVFPYRLEIVSRQQFQNPIIQERIQNLHPEIPNIQFSNLVLPNAKEEDLKYRQEVTLRLENPNREFETSFICRVAPNKDEDTFAFYAIDISLCSEIFVTTILQDFVADLTQYNIKAVKDGVEYSYYVESTSKSSTGRAVVTQNSMSDKVTVKAIVPAYNVNPLELVNFEQKNAEGVPECKAYPWYHLHKSCSTHSKHPCLFCRRLLYLPGSEAFPVGRCK